MRERENTIFVKSHVARDLLQNAAVFKTDKLVVWEYVANGLQYVDVGTNPVVRVSLDSRNKRIVVADNGRGMDWPGLQNFFVMHGENLDRKDGRPGRGRFGTGKSAAFGIGDVLRITTVRNGRRSKVELRRSEVDAMSSDQAVPVRTVEREVKTTEANGTIIDIEQVHLRSLDQAGLIRYIERHLARWPKNATVYVNNHECEYVEPPVAWERRFEPADRERAVLGDVALLIRVSKAPLEEDLRGIAIYCRAVWHETTLAGNEGRDMAQYIFGEIEVPRLDDDRSKIPPFDLTRSMRLNPSNPLVQAIYAFVGRAVDEIRRELVDAERKRKATDDAKRLVQEAAEIARVINEDFEDFRSRIAKVKAKSAGAVDAQAASAAEDSGDDLLFGNVLPAEITFPTGGAGSIGGDGGDGEESRKLLPQVRIAVNTLERQGRAATRTPNQTARGGFTVKFDAIGVDSHRAQYVRDERTIYINLDHPQLVAARAAGSLDDPIFRRLAYEVAFAEYAVALASELAARNEYVDPSDPIVEIRETLNRIARKGAALYSA